jgi:hypothetical protein
MDAISSAKPSPVLRLRGFALAGLAFLLVAPAAADTPRALEPPRMTQTPEPLCFCWNDGRKIPEGASACIRTTQGRRLAACGRVINMMSWQISDNPCPDS